MKINWKNENRKYENNVVYQITMGEYAYIGQTSRPLIMRVREHLYSKTSEVHNFIENNDIEEINVKILYHLPSNKKLDKKETKAIAQYIRYNSKKKGFKNLINKDFKGIDKKSIEELKDLIKKS
jgi:Uri superfamily endonuclease